MKRLLLLPAVLLLSGCGTISDIGRLGDCEDHFDSPGPHIYGGVRVDYLRSHEAEDTLFFSQSRMYILDMIFLSFPVDTALLPFTIVWAIVAPD